MSFVLCVLTEKSSTLAVLLQCLKLVNKPIWCLTYQCEIIHSITQYTESTRIVLETVAEASQPLKK